jgi:hypothetical protein
MTTETEYVDTPVDPRRAYESDAELVELVSIYKQMLRFNHCTQNMLNMVETLVATAYIAGRVNGIESIVARHAHVAAPEPSEIV